METQEGKKVKKTNTQYKDKKRQQKRIYKNQGDKNKARNGSTKKKNLGKWETGI